MLQSMTGYGRGEYAADDMKAVVEVRSVNHRFLDVSLRIARSLYGLEKQIKKAVSLCAARGKVDVSVQFEQAGAQQLNMSLNAANARQLAALMQQLQQATGLAGDVGVPALLTFKDLLFEQQEHEADLEKSWAVIEPALGAALQALQQMQLTEGAETARNISERIAVIQEHVREVEAVAPRALAARQEQLREKIKALCDGVVVDENRLTQEIALMADKSDITEELVRLQSHIKQFLQWIDADGAIGRKLDFLMQEMNRESNTIGSKTADSELALHVVEMKNELEKIREQIQNII